MDELKKEIRRAITVGEMEGPYALSNVLDILRCALQSTPEQTNEGEDELLTGERIEREAPELAGDA